MIKVKKSYFLTNSEIDLNNFTVKVNDEIISLTKKKLKFYGLATNQNKVFTREFVRLNLGFDYFGESRTRWYAYKKCAKLDNYEHKNGILR